MYRIAIHMSRASEGLTPAMESGIAGRVGELAELGCCARQAFYSAKKTGRILSNTSKEARSRGEKSK